MYSLLHKSGICPSFYGGRGHVGSRAPGRSLAICAPGASKAIPEGGIGRTWNVRGRPPVVICRAEQGRQLSVTDAVSLLAKVSHAWNKYDKDRNGTMSLKECEDIFNSKEVSEAFETITNMSHRQYTAADLEPYFKRADKDSSGTLSRTEFLALYLAVVGDRIKRNPLLLAEALLGFIDKDKNGVLEGKELKTLLAILGFAPALLMPIPGFMKIEYRAILKQAGGLLEGGGGKAGKA